MQFAIEAVIRTPVWVWALLAFLLFIGIRGLRPTVASFGRLLILPAVFLVWGLSGFATSYGFRPAGIAVWLAAIAIGAALGWLMARAIAIKADRDHGLVRLPGTWVNLVLILIIFAVKYTLGILAGFRPSITGELLYMATDVGVSGLLTGMFAGRLYGLWRKYQTAPQENLAA